MSHKILLASGLNFVRSYFPINTGGSQTSLFPPTLPSTYERETCLAQLPASDLPLRRSEVLRSLRNYLRMQSHTQSIAWWREVWKEKVLDDLP